MMEGLYLLPHTSGRTYFVGAISTSTWHKRLGHTSCDRLKYILNHFSLNYENSDFNAHCDICHYAKQPRKLFPLSAFRSHNAFDLLHIDVWGNFHTPTIHRKKYFLTVVEVFFLIFLIDMKSECFSSFKNLDALISNQFKVSIKAIRSLGLIMRGILLLWHG